MDAMLPQTTNQRKRTDDSGAFTINARTKGTTMIHQESTNTLAALPDGTRARFQAWAEWGEDLLNLPKVMSADIGAMTEASGNANSYGTHAAAEVWVLNVTLNERTRALLTQSTATYRYDLKYGSN